MDDCFLLWAAQRHLSWLTKGRNFGFLPESNRRWCEPKFIDRAPSHILCVFRCSLIHPVVSDCEAPHTNKINHFKSQKFRGRCWCHCWTWLSNRQHSRVTRTQKKKCVVCQKVVCSNSNQWLNEILEAFAALFILIFVHHAKSVQFLHSVLSFALIWILNA